MMHRGVSFSVTETVFPNGWKWTVEQAHTISVGVCATREDAICSAKAFIDAILDWAA